MSRQILSLLTLMAFLAVAPAVASTALNVNRVPLGDTVKGPSDDNGKV